MSQPLIEFDRLSVQFATEHGVARAVQEVSFAIHAGESVAVVGESGCGKSVTALSLMGLLPPAPACRLGGEVRLDAANLLALPPAAWRPLRGRDIAMVFQEPMSALNPVLTVGEQLMEPLLTHRQLSPAAAWQQAIALLQQVGIARPEAIAASYPHQLSGGMLQRVMLAIAISCQPRLLIADEPTTALDVTIQAQILDLLRRLQQASGMALLLITHDLGIVAEMADRVVVMYAGRVVETGSVRDIFRHPQHPYTQGLLASRPVPGRRLARLAAIPGQVPSPLALPDHCAFAERCPHAQASCLQQQPALRATRPGQQVACLLAGITEEAA